MSSEPKKPADETKAKRRDSPRHRFRLEELVAEMTPDREHPFDDDGPNGEEII